MSERFPDLNTLSHYPAVNAARFADEATLRAQAVAALGFDDPTRSAVLARARGWVSALRRDGRRSLLDRFLGEFGLSSREGVALMCLAEAALRIPDEQTLDDLIRDQLAGTEWRSRDGHGSLFVNASTWALMLTGRFLETPPDGADPDSGLLADLRRRVQRSGEPLVRNALRQAMNILGQQFVMGRDIDGALARAARGDAARERHSFDMLGEAARTAADAETYFERYLQAIEAVGRAATVRGADAGPETAPGVSIKLSALHPRFEAAQWAGTRAPLLERTLTLARAAAAHNIGLTIDAEEAARLDPQLDLLAALCAEPALAGWDGLGVAVQAYQRRALAVVALLGELSERHQRRLMVRLVKGAYWDTEIKLAQQQGLPGYPVFTRKVNTDLCWLACARRLFALAPRIYPQFATHNAHSIAAVLAMAQGQAFELQRLHGMGEALYAEVERDSAAACRAYDPVGSHRDLLPYLVRRLLENGANSSFVHRIADADEPVERVVADPLSSAAAQPQAQHPRIPAPRDLYRPERANSAGIDLSDPDALARLYAAMAEGDGPGHQAAALIAGRAGSGPATPPRALHAPHDRRLQVGTVSDGGSDAIAEAVTVADAAAPDWARTPAEERAACLECAADGLETALGELVALCCREAGKTIPDGIAEVREAADFLRYYAARARALFAAPQVLAGPTGESNQLSLHGRGVFACISPWNFPLAIFTGQLGAALAAGNSVVAKPAEQTPLIAARAVAILHAAGIPPAVLGLVPGDGPGAGAPLVADPRITGVAFTGSVAAARSINRALAERDGPIVPLIAETGGQNAMVVDSSALTEQAVADIVQSSFQSAGQRCSALRVLFVQEEAAERTLRMLAGAMEALRIGDPWDIATDVGPVIDDEAKQRLDQHCARMDREARLIHRCSLPAAAAHGTFVAPAVYELARLEQLTEEVFGPILHLIRYPAGGLDAVLEAINATGYGLTFGVHSRIDERIRRLTARVRAGNQYVNRNMIGAVVGVQPFGGEGLSGTGPKAGGPHYLPRFAVERALSVNTAAAGGNAALLSLSDDQPVNATRDAPADAGAGGPAAS